ncbi:cyclin-dependent kinase 5 activator 2b [Hypomesus transpacificus]|uniref:cyclin-dependent kinase 5 activator 2b n=1 Tax=Hypomesus transpacificus TaxID=137520 RepID=UPI001F074CCC|nr:cyclin-dependent kinase 5 activator 2b [Hypomesus transpacificus]
MGTVLSFSPTASKGALLDDRNGINNNEGTVKRQSMLVSALVWTKSVAASNKKKSVKKVSPDPPASQVSNNQVEHLNHENHKKSQQSESEPQVKAPLAVPVPTVPTQNLQPSQTNGVTLLSIKKQPSRLSVLSPRRVIVQASTGELLRCLGDFLCRRCYKLKELSSGEVILWFRNVDRTLLIQGWQDHGFITPANLVFVYLLCKDIVTEDIDSASELQGTFLSCLYLAYSYMGNEISYPLKPFVIEANKDVFWDRSLTIIDRMSAKMLQLNSDPHFFTEVFQDLKEEGDRDNSVDR